MDKNSLSVELFNKLATAYQEKFMDVSSYSGPLDDFSRRIRHANPRLLDIACGPGNISRYLLDRHPESKLLGIDLAPNMLDLARTANPEAEFQLMDARRIADLDAGYAGIVCGFCMPYLSKEEALQLIADASKLLLPGGAFFLSTMEGNYADSDFHASSSYPEEKLFIHYHQEDYLKKGLEENGFVALSITRQDYEDGKGTNFSDLLVVAEKGK